MAVTVGARSDSTMPAPMLGHPELAAEQGLCGRRAEQEEHLRPNGSSFASSQGLQAVISVQFGFW